MFFRRKVRVLAVTVGTSLFSNLGRIEPDKNPELADLKQSYDMLKSSDSDLVRNSQLKAVSEYLLNLPPESRIQGAEINSVYAMLEKGFLDDERHLIVFLTSDTEDGRDIGKILCSFFENEKSPIKFNECRSVMIEGLQDSKPLIFKRDGLSNLVREMGSLYARWKDYGFGINSTGGYKAQIALAVAFGQVMQVPVYYKHERFNQIISFPHVPFTIDLEPIKDHLEFWADITERKEFRFSEVQNYRLPQEYMDEILPLLDEVEIDGENWYSLSPLGLIYWNRFINDNPEISIPLEKIKKDARKGVTFRDDHFPEGFRDFVKKLYNENDFITSCHSLPYHGQKSIKHGKFYEYKGNIAGGYCGKSLNARVGINIKMNANSLERKWAIDMLTKWFKDRYQ